MKQNKSTSRQPQRQAGTTVSRPIVKIAGLEGVTPDMLVVPRIKLVQKMSVETDLDISPGTLVNSVTKEVIVDKKKPLTIIPIINTITRLLFRPMKEGGGIVCRSFDGKNGVGAPGGNCMACPKARWAGTIPPECTDLLNVFVMVRGYDHPIPITLSFGRSSAKAGKQLVNLFYMQSLKTQKSPWHFAYDVKPQEVENDKGKFWIFGTVTGAGEAKKNEIEQGELMYNLLKISQVQIHEDENEVEQEAANANTQAGDDSARKKGGSRQPRPMADDDPDNPFRKN
jgi:hypothetical protein